MSGAAPHVQSARPGSRGANRKVPMKSRQTGVSLTELIVVLGILAVAATVALPRKLGPADLARAASDSMTVNFAGCASTGHRSAERTCVRVTRCDQAGQLMDRVLPPGHRIEGAAGRYNGEHLRCRVHGPDGVSAEFSGLVAGV